MTKAIGRNRIRFAARLLTAIFVLPHLLMVGASTAALAQIQGSNYVAVLDFANLTKNGDPQDVRTATDAVVVELTNSDKFTVATSRQVQEAMNSLDLHPPLDITSLVRLAKEMSVTHVIVGSLRSITFTNNPRQARVEIEVRQLDGATGEVINGAIARGQSTPVQNGAADDEVLKIQAINNAAFVAVRTMLNYIIPEATVLNAIGEDKVLLNRGAQDGLRIGMEMLISRNTEVIGKVRVIDVSNNDATAVVLPGSTRGVKPEDRARAIFKIPEAGVGTYGEKASDLSGGVVGAGKSKKGAGKLIPMVLGLLLLAVLLGQGNSHGETVGTNLKAEATGSLSTPAVRITLDPKRFDQTNIIQYKVWRSDQPTPVFAVPFNTPFVNDTVVLTPTAVSYLEVDPLDNTADPTATSGTNPGIVPGTSYDYSVSAIYRTLSFSGGGDSGGGTGGTSTYKYFETAQQPVGRATPLEKITTANMLEPLNNAQDVDLAAISFSWLGVLGADTYIVEVATDPLFSHVVFRSGIISASPSVSGQQVFLPNQNLSTPLAGATSSTPVFWRVGARNSADSPGPITNQITSLRYIYGDVSQFSPKDAPPPPP